MQELLAIPDSVRSDAEWDELNELEIQLAAVNREGAPPPRTHANPKRRGPPPQQRQQQARPAAAGGGAAPAGGTPNKPSGRKFHKRPPKPVKKENGPV